MHGLARTPAHVHAHTHAHGFRAGQRKRHPSCTVAGSRAPRRRAQQSDTPPPVLANVPASPPRPTSSIARVQRRSANQATPLRMYQTSWHGRRRRTSAHRGAALPCWLLAPRRAPHGRRPSCPVAHTGGAPAGFAAPSSTVPCHHASVCLPRGGAGVAASVQQRPQGRSVLHEYSCAGRTRVIPHRPRLPRCLLSRAATAALAPGLPARGGAAAKQHRTGVARPSSDPRSCECVLCARRNRPEGVGGRWRARDREQTDSCPVMQTHSSRLGRKFERVLRPFPRSLCPRPSRASPLPGPRL